MDREKYSEHRPSSRYVDVVQPRPAHPATSHHQAVFRNPPEVADLPKFVEHELISFRQHLVRMLQTAGHSWSTSEHDVFLTPFRKAGRALGRIIPTRLKGFDGWQATYFGLLFLALIAIPAGILVHNALNAQRYELSAAVKQLVGPPVVRLDKQLSYDAKSHAYQYNPGAANGVQQSSDGAGDNGMTIGGSKYYGVDLAAKAKNGQTYTDAATKLSFTLVPEFGALDGKRADGHVVYPIDQGQAIYTLKDNGLKEDVVLSEPTDTVQLAYKLQLPSDLQARLNDDGSIGIYSADPSLFGNISYGSDKDQQMVENARQKGAKNNLVFIIPAPEIVQSGKAGGAGRAQFSLNGNMLTVTATHLQDLNYPISIDPSVVIQSANSFTSGNDEDSNSVISTGSVTRGSLTGGALGTWASANTGTTFGVRNQVTSIAYNGYLYAVGGANAGTNYTDVYYASILGNGQVGNWVQTSSILVARTNTSLITYNGYLYMIAGNNAGNTSFDEVEYALICTGSNAGKAGCSSTAGSLGTWLYANGTATQGGSVGTSVDGSRLNQAVAGAMVVSYNDFIYVMGGCTATPVGGCTGITNLVQVARVKGDGTLTAWTNQGTLPATRFSGGAAAYNNHIYITAGCTAGSSTCSASAGDTIIAPINSDGTLGSWVTSTYTLTTSQYVGISTYVYHGYLYYLYGSTGGTVANYAQYAPIYANGLIGPWRTTNTFATATSGAGYAVYNGYVYQVAGCTASSANCSAYSNVVAYSAINAVGAAGTYLTSTATSYETDGLMVGTSVAYGGHLYMLGGSNTINQSGATTNVYYTTLNSDGSIGNWGTTSQFSVARNGAAAVAYNGYMYIMGGWHNSSDTLCSATTSQYCADVQKAVINSDGTLGTWSSAGGNYSTTGRGWLGAAVYNGYLYVIGGVYNNNSSVSAETDVGQIQSSGNVTGWTTTGSLLNGTSDFGVAQAGPYVYVLGGRISGGSNYSNAIEYAVLNSSGTITWGNVSNVFTTGRSDFTAGASNGFVYITAGATGTGNNVLNDTQYARICLDTSLTDGCNGTVGTLGAWHTTSSFTTGRTGGMSAIYNGYLYIMGGCSNQGVFGACSSSAALLNDTQYAPLNNGGPGTVGLWASATSLPTNLSDMRSVAYNGYLYTLGGQSDVATSFNYTGGSQTYTVPAGVTQLTIAAYGAQGGGGGSPSTALGGLGGYARETISVTPGETLQINVGGKGVDGVGNASSPALGGWNGGGSGGYNTSNSSASGGGGGGGGASDVRQAGTALSNRVLVAGGGGGGGASGSSVPTGGGGGDTVGANGLPAGQGGGGGTQSAGGTASGFGSTAGGSPTQDQGGAGGKEGQLSAINGGGGGGGGYYGGGGGGDNHNGVNPGGGGGGSGYVLPAAVNQTMQTGVQGGNGRVDILLPTQYNTVQYAKLTSNGSLASDAGCGSAWCSTTGFSNGRSDFAAEVYNGYVYILGGETTGGTYYNDVQYAKLTSTGAIASDSGCGAAWCVTTSFPTARAYVSSAMYNGYLYLLGGFNGTSVSNGVHYAKLTSTGAIASDSGCGAAWCVTTSFSTGRMGQTSVQNNGYLYVLGGSTAGGTYYNDVQYAKLTSTGAIASDSGCGAAWCVTTSFPTARNVHNSWVYDGYLYTAGGYTGSGYASDVEFAPILSNGAIGNWQGTTNIPSAVGSSARAVYGGYVYLLGGCTGGSPCTTFANSVQYAPLQSIPRISHYSRLIDLASTVNGNTGGNPQITRYRTLGASSPSLIGPSNINVCWSGTTSTSAVFGTPTCNQNITLSSLINSSSYGRYVMMYMTLDDSQSASFPESNQTSLSELDVYFHASPQRRLRMGQTFTDRGVTGGTVNQLDTEGP